MRTILYISVIAVLFSSCSASYRAGLAEYDDLYYTPKKAVVQEPVAVADTQPAVQENSEAAVEEMSEYEKYRLGLESEYQSGESGEPNALT